MSGYEQRLAEDKDGIRRRVVAVGHAVSEAVEGAVEALLAQDERAAYRIILGDLPINREVRALDARCHAFIARHIPSAGHLRFVSSVLQMNIALERVGDYAVTIAREATELKSAIPEALVADLKKLSGQACTLLRDALVAFSDRDAELARKTRPRAKAIERAYSEVHRDLTREGAALPIADAFSLLTVFRRLERVADQAKNLSEETLFELTGEQKAPKTYKILFVDDDGALLAPTATALARKAFPGSGEYECASVSEHRGVSSQATQLGERRGIDLVDVRVQDFGEIQTDLERFHVVAAIGSGVGARLGRIPYGLVKLEWDVDLPQQTTDESLDEVTNQLAQHVRDLMVLMRGEDAP